MAASASTAGPAMGKWSRRAGAAGAALALAGGGLAAGIGVAGGNAHPDASRTTARQTETAPVELRDLVATERLSGTLGFGPARPVLAPRPGRLTAHPPAGTRVGRGDVLYEVDGAEVELLLGARPFWRPLEVGIPDGPDVRQLEENLVALGFAKASMGVDNRFTPATAEAVKRWQRARQRQQTGTFDPSDAAVHSEPLRVAEFTVPLGASIAAGAALAMVTSAVEQVTADVKASDLDVVSPGATVKVELDDGVTVPGRVEEVLPRRSPPEQNMSGPAEFTATITVDVPDDRAIELAPVDVRVERTRASGVLAVPVAALLARAGGFAVEVVTSSTTRKVVAIEIGVDADGYVEVRGALKPGDHVVVAPT